MRSRSSAFFRLLTTGGVLAVGVFAGVFLAQSDFVPGLATPAYAASKREKKADDEYVVVRSPLTEMVERVSPSIVNVGAEKKQRFIDPWRSSFFQPYIREQILREPFMGSGFIVDDEGHVITNNHVIEYADAVFVTLTDGRQVTAKVLGADPFSDVAVLKIDLPKDELPEPMQLGDSDKLQIAETVLAIGNPFGNLIDDPRPTVTRGVVSALHRSFRPDAENRVYHDMIQTDAAINPGNSGGPLVDELGRAVGMNTFIMSRDGGSNGLGFAIPANRVRAILNEIIEHGGIRDTLVDFDVTPLSTPRVTGLLISRMVEKGPAESAGLDLGDVILKVEGRPVQSGRELALVLASRSIGEKVRMEIWRSGETRTVEYVVEAAGKRQ